MSNKFKRKMQRSNSLTRVIFKDDGTPVRRKKIRCKRNKKEDKSHKKGNK